jgi:DNA-binding NarL/FixJ family response regulator
VPADAQPLRILIADRDAIFRRGVREILNEEVGLRVVGEAVDGAQAIKLAGELRPGLDLILMDVELPHPNAFAATEQLTAQQPDLAVVMLTSSELEAQFLDAVRVGAVGYLRRNLEPDALLRVLHSFHRGEGLPMSRVMAHTALIRLREQLSDAQTGEQTLPPLTPREREVCELIARGARDREIATQLVLSHSTAKKHVQNILRKLHARNRAEAVARLQALPTWPALPG